MFAAGAAAIMFSCAGVAHATPEHSGAWLSGYRFADDGAISVKTDLATDYCRVGAQMKDSNNQDFYDGCMAYFSGVRVDL